MTRLLKNFTEVAEQVRLELQASKGISQEQLDSFRARVEGNGHQFPENSVFVDFDQLYLDYEVQRQAIPDHILGIMKRFDPRLCTPASASRVTGQDYITLYDGQQHSIAMYLLGYSGVPATVVQTDDPAFPSYAFEELNESGVKRLTPGDLHRNALTRYKLGSREEKNVRARTMQDQFDKAGIDLEDKGTRKSANLRGNRDYYFSHFKYADKGIALDKSGKTLFQILEAIRSVFPLQEEIDQGVYIGLYELARLDTRQELPPMWMARVLHACAKYFNSSATLHSKAKLQHAHVFPGASWSAPSAMANFLRELYIMEGGSIQLPYHGEGALMQVATNPAPGLFPSKVA